MSDIELLTQLRLLLGKRFSDGELRTLCFDLGVDYEDLPGSGKSDKARELANYMDRYDRLPDLVRMGRQARPDVPWPEISAAAGQPTIGGTPTSVAAGGTPTLKAIKRQALQRRLAELSEEYEAISQQLGYSLSAVDRVRIQRQIETLEAEIGRVDAELKALR